MERNVSEIAEDTPIRRKANILDAEVDGEIVALDVEGGECYGLNSVASEVWMHLVNQTSVSQMCQQLTEKFEVPEHVCRHEVLQLVRRLDDDGLIELGGPN
jgi:hypothetical protein